MENLQFAKNLFQEYRHLTENEVTVFNDLKTSFPGSSFPKHANRVWRYAVLAEAWGSIATKLGGGMVNYLDDWRTGK